MISVVIAELFFKRCSETLLENTLKMLQINVSAKCFKNRFGTIQKIRKTTFFKNVSNFFQTVLIMF